MKWMMRTFFSIHFCDKLYLIGKKWEGVKWEVADMTQ